MHAIIPVENYALAFQMVCCFFTVLAAFASYVFTMRF